MLPTLPSDPCPSTYQPSPESSATLPRLALAWCLSLLAVPGLVSASSSRAPDPADPAASTPALLHRPALRHYQPLQERPVGDWPAANRRVQELGGWRHYLREAQASASPASSAASAVTAPARAASTPHAH